MEGFVLFLVAMVSMGMAMGHENSSWNVSAMYVLGDSSVDCGANTLFYPIFHLHLSLLPCNGSNSILLPYLLANKMGLPYAEPFYTQNGTIDGLLRGVNYGAAHATILTASSLGHQSLNHQLRQVFESVQLLQLQLGHESSRWFIRSSLFYLSFGKDDYIDLFLRNFSGVMAHYNDHLFAEILVNEMVHAMMNLYDMNVRKVVEINEVILKYNVLLEDSVLRLNDELPDAHIVFCDLYQGLNKILSFPHIFGFEDAKNAFCGLGLYGTEIGCITSDIACNPVSSNVWWDLYNPTPRVNSLLAESTWSGQELSPTSVVQLPSMIWFTLQSPIVNEFLNVGISLLGIPLPGIS
ncbi:Pyridine nucleotide-disulfide oxidoreductase family protein [Hibiscus syriacus]|uniref:Pyridine nucleotide-disulfide oxidoreductase family protein n=1 Tax=Hibiscus syriacus TaxID=106335 RepID=A0A6A2WSJ4_HIBSY|nr:Pyridine nucleotide-disulfide oxidoreductase family protein [Hibiscus syriacus]